MVPEAVKPLEQEHVSEEHSELPEIMTVHSVVIVHASPSCVGAEEPPSSLNSTRKYAQSDALIHEFERKIYLFICLSVCLSIYLSIYLAIYLPIKERKKERKKDIHSENLSS